MQTLMIDTTHKLLESLHSGGLPLNVYIDELESIYETKEADIMAFIAEDSRFERLRNEAALLEKRYPDPKSRPALFGLPIGIKDIFHVDGFDTKAGSKIPVEALADKEASCVAALKKAGALIFGKTVTTEFAYFAPGPTRNPHNLAHTPGGSSSGSAAAIAAGMVPLTLGTQTIGSVTRPASFCGVFGYKPSYDRINKTGVIPLASSLDHVGLFSLDLSIILAAATELCNKWKTTSSSNIKPALAIPEGSYIQKASPQMLSHLETVVARLEDTGYEVKKLHILENIEEIRLRHETILAVEATRTHQTWYSEYPDKYHAKTRDLIESGKYISDQEYQLALQSLEILRQDIIQSMEDHSVDLWLSPSAVGAAPKGLDNTGDPIMNLPWSHSGLPTVNIPSGKNIEGLPLGLQLTAGWYQDEKLLGWAKGIAEVVS